jgi:hypothetical protein
MQSLWGWSVNEVLIGKYLVLIGKYLVYECDICDIEIEACLNCVEDRNYMTVIYVTCISHVVWSVHKNLFILYS